MQKTDKNLRLAIPSGRIQASVIELLQRVMVTEAINTRDYRMDVSRLGISLKRLKPSIIPFMVGLGSMDIGFCGKDWIAEHGVDVVTLADLGTDAVSIIAAAPRGVTLSSLRVTSPVVIATEYPNLARMWAERHGLDAFVFRTGGTTEAFPPDDADCIVDNTSTGATLRANGLEVIDEIMGSSTVLIASKAAWLDPRKRPRIEAFCCQLGLGMDDGFGNPESQRQLVSVAYD